jgi:RNA polymerase sigma factor (sigma-70 family)
MEPEPSFEPLERLLAHEPFVRALARSLVSDEALAEDAVQDTWLAALQGTPGAVRSPRAWLARVVRNFAFRSSRSSGRRSRREREAARPEALPSTEEIVGREEARRRLVEAVLALEEPYRRTVLLRYFEGLPPREIARRSGVPVATVGTRLRRAHDRLRERLDAEHGGDRRAWCLALAPLAFAAPAAEAASAGSGISLAEGLLMKASTKAAIGATLLVAVGLIALLPTRMGEETASLTPRVPAPPVPLRTADASGGPASETPLRVPASTTASSSPALAGRVEIRGRLLVRGGGPLGTATVGVRTGEESIDFPETVARLGGTDELRELRAEGGFLLEEAVREAGGWKPAFETAALADGSFALAVPEDLPEFRFEVKADYAEDGSSDRFLPADPRLREGVRLLLEPAGKVEGSILIPSGAAARNGRFARFEPGGYMPSRAEAADAQGHFAIRGLGPGRHSFVAMGEGGAPLARLDVPVRAGETTRIDFDLPAESWIAGRVVDGNGRGVANASIGSVGPGEIVPGLLASRLGALRYPWCRTAPDGRFRVGSLLHGEHSLRIDAEGFFAVNRGPLRVPAGGGLEGLEVVLESGHRLSGRVLDTAGRPAEGLAVIVVRDEEAAKRRNVDLSKRRSFRQRTRTAADGTFSVAGLDAVPLIVSARRGGKLLVERRDVEPDGDGLELVVGTPTGIAGVVLDAGGSPVGAFRIVPLRVTDSRVTGRLAGWGDDRRPGREFVSEDGTFEWTELELGTFDFRVEAKGLVAQTLADIQVVAGEVRRGLEIRLEPGATIRGRVVERGSGAVVAGARVEIVPRQESVLELSEFREAAATSAEDGTFEVSGLPPGPTRLTVTHEGFVEGMTDEVEGRPGKPVEGLLVELARGGAVEGLAVGRDGLPFAGGSAVAIPSERPWRSPLKNTTIEEGGRFRIGGLAAGRYRVEACPRLVGTTPREEIEKRRLSGLLQVDEGKVTTVAFFPPSSGDAVVRGRVVQGEEGLPGFEVWVRPLAFQHDWEESHARYGRLRDRAGAEGAYRIEGVPEGEAEVSISKSGVWRQLPAQLWARRRIHVPPTGEIDCSFHIPSGAITGRVVSAGRPVAGLNVRADLATGGGPNQVEWGVADDTGHGGAYSLPCLPAGTYTVSVGGRVIGMERENDDLIPATKEASLTEGGRAVVDFDLERGASALVEVRDSTGKPAAGVGVWVGPVAGAREGRRGGQEWRTDRYGVARVTALQPGLSVATVVRAPGFAATFSEEKEVRFDEEPRFRLDLREGTRVRVRVLDAEGAAVKDAEVFLRDDRGFATPATRGASGWEAVTLPGSYVLEVTAGERGRKALPVRVGEEPAEFHVRLGED